MSLLNLKNKNLDQLKQDLDTNLAKAGNNIEKTILYNYYMEGLKDTINDHMVQAVHYNKFKNHLQDMIDSHQNTNAYIYESILNLKKLGYKVQDLSSSTSYFLNQPLNGVDDVNTVNNPYSWWGYIESSQKYYAKIPVVVEDEYEPFLINGTYLEGFKMIIKDNNEPYVMSEGDLIISEDSNVQTDLVNTGSMNTIKVLVDSREQAVNIIKKVFSTFELKNESIFVQGDGVYKYSWGGIIEVDHL